ncbi:TOBE domain-containing protein [Flavobacterium sp.]|uniref:TOBE domain-containing protein n=1 Tax=Flavobacterium sp. TaxID=239 RepID=UPI003C325E56
MNILTGKIAEIESEGSLSLVKVTVQNCNFTTIVIDTTDSSTYLSRGENVKVIFKETEVILSKNLSGIISLQNKMDCTVSHFEIGKLLCKVVLKFQEETIISVITRNAFEQLNICGNDEIVAMIKTNEISLSPHD